MDTTQLKERIVQTLEDNKAQDIQVMDVVGITDIADVMIIASGTSDRHVSALSSHVISDCRDSKRKPIGHEGEESQDKEWLLVDYGDIIVHIMRQQAREFYDLESLWGEDMRKLVAKQRKIPPLGND